MVKKQLNINTAFKYLMLCCALTLAPQIFAQSSSDETPYGTPKADAICDKFSEATSDEAITVNKSGPLRTLCKVYCHSWNCDGYRPRISEQYCVKLKAKFDTFDKDKVGLSCEINAQQ